MDLKSLLPVWPDWPINGVNFIDVCGILNKPDAFEFVVSAVVENAKQHKSSSIVAIDSRGFLFGSVVANKLKLPLVLVRKPNKLPGPTKSTFYSTEYNESNTLAIQQNAPIGDRPYVVDDLLATGGTLLAACQLLNKRDTRCGVVINLSFLKGLTTLKNLGIECDFLIEYNE